ncbi:hypothetical protein [Arthrobacter sp. GMC3]|uniref:hypothetical protein n=1 Tax=Arthrobacter sp. GMC3 TaxID=2058894 RepID=UPI0015E3863E|nr:hypothetical protein [Arthrobacter sp. GMC3]
MSLLTFAWVVSAGLTFIDEGRTPPESAFPTVPGPALVKSVSKQCASGGCWREMAIETGSTAETKELINEMDLSQERCGARNLLTLIRICTGSGFEGKELGIYLRYDY